MTAQLAILKVLKKINKYINSIFTLIAKAEKRWWEWQGICYWLQDYVERLVHLFNE